MREKGNMRKIAKDPRKAIGAYRQWHYELKLSYIETRIILEVSKGYEKGEGGLSFRTQDDLAKRYGVIRLRLCRALKVLKELELITVGKGLIRPSKRTILFSNLKNSSSKTQRGM